MLHLQTISYQHPNKDRLFDNLHLTINKNEKVALTGDNGSGKSTLLKIIAGELLPSSGQVKTGAIPYYVPQMGGQYDHLTIAQALGVDKQLRAMKEILNGKATEENLSLLNDDWTLEERCHDALRSWNLEFTSLNQLMGTLSGGEKTRVFLSGILLHTPSLVLMDEPSNHLDAEGREQLYEFIITTSATLLVVSHDRKLLNLLDTTCELNSNGISVYGGNYDFYVEQKQIETEALNQDIHSKEKALRKSRVKERETAERQNKLDARGKAKQEKAGVARIMMNTLRNKAENSTSKLKDVHASKIEGISKDLKDLRAALPDVGKMKFDFDNSGLHKGKILFTATGINFKYGFQSLWKNDLELEIISGDRIRLKGTNGSGKTSLIKLLLGILEPSNGTIYRSENRVVYIDQDYSLINDQLSVYDQVQHFNHTCLQDHEIKTRLSRFLFLKNDWDKPCAALSGGERMRLMICCLNCSNQSPDVIVLDEPTNNLDIRNSEILTAAINDYEGTLIVISHDDFFCEQIRIDKTIALVKS